MASALSLTERDRQQIDEVLALARNGDVAALIDRLRIDRWPVRRATVAALADMGTAALTPLCDVLLHKRDDEGQIAAVVDALSASQADVTSTIEQLAQHATPAIVCDAATILGRRRSEPSVPLLGTLTAHPDDNVAVAAVEALGRIGGDAAIEALLGLAATGSFFRVFPTLDVLGRSRDPRATDVLSRLLDDPLYAPEAARALGRTGDERSLDALLKLLVRSTDAVVRVAAVALIEVHDRIYGRFGTTVENLMPRVPTSPITRLKQALASSDPFEEAAIIRVLGLLGGDEAITALLEIVTRGDGRAVAVAESVLRELGAHALGPLLEMIRTGNSDERAVLLPLVGARATDPTAIIACLVDPVSRVRAFAIETLTRMGYVEATPALFVALRDADPRVAQAAIAAIQSLGSDGSETLAIEAARDPNPAVRRAGIRILAYFGYRGALEPLLAATSDPDERVRDVALGGLPLLDDPRGDAALFAAVRHPSARTRAAAVRALGHVGQDRDVHALLSTALDDSDAWVRYFACQALARRRDERAIPALVERLEDTAGQVRVGAIEALAQFRDDRASGALTRAAEGADPDMRRAAIIGFGLTGRTSSLPLIADALRDDDASTRLVAVSALAALPGVEPLEAIVRATGDPDPPVSSAAINVLGGRPEPAAFDRLIALLDDTRTAERAMHAMAQSVVGRAQTIALALSHATPERATLLAAALLRMRTPEANAALIGALATPKLRTRMAIASALAVVPLPEHRSAIQHALDVEHDPDIRKHLRRALST
jgi:HEAT repeat protein